MINDMIERCQMYWQTFISAPLELQVVSGVVASAVIYYLSKVVAFLSNLGWKVAFPFRWAIATLFKSAFTKKEFNSRSQLNTYLYRNTFYNFNKLDTRDLLYIKYLINVYGLKGERFLEDTQIKQILEKRSEAIYNASNGFAK